MVNLYSLIFVFRYDSKVIRDRQTIFYIPCEHNTKLEG